MLEVLFVLHFSLTLLSLTCFAHHRMLNFVQLDSPYRNLDAIKKIFLEEGVSGFYRGWGTIMVNSIPASAVWWTIYEAVKTFVSKQAYIMTRSTDIKSTMQQSNNKSNPEVHGVVHKHFLGQLLGGAIAGGCVTTLTNPLDMIRTRLQTQHMHTHSQSHSHSVESSLEQPPARVHYQNLRHAISTIYKQEGFAAFFKGLGPRMSSYVLFSTIGALAYELAVDLSTRKKKELL